MGTVGLSFGSPTSGAGFDVSTTVAQMVSNLQNVETPWKNQLTALTSQDTVLSNLGTLLSTVSTDLGNLTDFTGVMAQKTGSSSDTNVVELTNASSSATAGTHTITVTSLAATSSGYLNAVTNASDQLSGSISIQVGSGKAQTVSVNSSSDTLAGLQAAINAAGIGVTASVLTDANGSRLSLVSGTSGTNGNLTVTSSITDSSNSGAQLTYNPVIKGADASLNVDGVELTSASNTVTNLISGVTFQLLAPSSKASDGTQEQVQVIIGNDNSGVETAVNQFVTDYNALIAALNSQEGKDSSGNPEPLFGSPTLSLLQQQLMTAANTQNPSGYIDPVTDGSTLSGSMSLAVGSGVTDTIVIGAGTNTANTFYTGAGVNTLQGVADAINAADSGTTLSFTSGSGNTGGTLAAVATGNALSGSMTLTLGDGTTENVVMGDQPADGPAASTIYTGSSSLTLTQLAATINGASAFGVTANVTTDANGLQTLALTATGSSTLTVNSSILAAGPGVTAAIASNNGQSTLTLQSQTAGTTGALTVSPSLKAAAPTPLTYTGTAATGSQNATGLLSTIPAGADVLSGSISIQVGSGTPQSITIDSSDNTLQGLADVINNTTGLGVTASVTTNSDGSAYLSLSSGTAGSAGNLTVTSNILDTTHTTGSQALNYTNSSDLSTLANLGITVSTKDDGTLTFDQSTLDAALNSDFSGALGFFQNSNSWGQVVTNILNNAGTTSTNGILSLAQKSNSAIETTLNADVTKEDAIIATQKTQLTTELNQANEILQQIPTELQGVNELYSAISGYNQNSNGG